MDKIDMSGFGLDFDFQTVENPFQGHFDGKQREETKIRSFLSVSCADSGIGRAMALKNYWIWRDGNG